MSLRHLAKPGSGVKGGDQPSGVFISHAPGDVRYREQVRYELGGLQTHGMIKLNSYDTIQPGEEASTRVREFIDYARIAILLISPEFLTSNRIFEEEVPRLIEKHAQGDLLVWPILLRATHYEFSPFLRDIQFVDKKPLSEMDEPETHRMFKSLSEHIFHHLFPTPPGTHLQRSAIFRELFVRTQHMGLVSLVLKWFKERLIYEADAPEDLLRFAERLVSLAAHDGPMFHRVLAIPNDIATTAVHPILDLGDGMELRLRPREALDAHAAASTDGFGLLGLSEAEDPALNELAKARDGLPGGDPTGLLDFLVKVRTTSDTGNVSAITFVDSPIINFAKPDKEVKLMLPEKKKNKKQCWFKEGSVYGLIDPAEVINGISVRLEALVVLSEAYDYHDWGRPPISWKLEHARVDHDVRVTITIPGNVGKTCRVRFKTDNLATVAMVHNCNLGAMFESHTHTRYRMQRGAPSTFLDMKVLEKGSPTDPDPGLDVTTDPIIAGDRTFRFMNGKAAVDEAVDAYYYDDPGRFKLIRKLEPVGIDCVVYGTVDATPGSLGKSHDVDSETPFIVAVLTLIGNSHTGETASGMVRDVSLHQQGNTTQRLWFNSPGHRTVDGAGLIPETIPAVRIVEVEAHQADPWDPEALSLWISNTRSLAVARPTPLASASVRTPWSTVQPEQDNPKGMGPFVLPELPKEEQQDYVW